MKRTIMIIMVLTALLPTILIGFAVNHYIQTSERTEKLDEMANLIHMVNIQVSKYYENLVTGMKQKAEEDILRGYLMLDRHDDGNSSDRIVIRKMLLDSVGIPVTGGMLVDSAGKIVISTVQNEEGLMLDQTELYSDIMGGRTSHFDYIMSGGETDVLTVAVPVRDIQGRTIGILRQEFGTDLLITYLDSIKAGKTGSTFLLRGNGSLIYDRNKENPVALFHEYQDNDSLEQLVSDMKSGVDVNKGIIEFKTRGKEYIGAYEKVSPVQSIAITAMQKEEIYEGLSELQTVLSSLFLLSLGIIALIGYLIGKFHAKGLKIMNDMLRNISNGDLTARCQYSGRKAFIELYRNINQLADAYQKSERELRMSSRIDNLTHLPNHNAINEVLDTLLYKHRNQALLLLDLEGFKDINQNLGHDIGDRILMEIGDILRNLPQHVCYPSRIGGAEFLVFITHWTAPRYPERIAEKILKEIEEIRFIDEIHVDISANIGIEYRDEEKTDKKKLIKYANIAMHKARNIGRNSYFVHYPDMQ
mgnify:CR=1 FL=1